MPHRSSLCLMASMIREGALSPTELVEEHLKEIERRNPALNAFVEIYAEEALAEARERESELHRGRAPGLLHGIPVTIKDSFNIAGRLTRSGSRLRTPPPASADAGAVARLRAAGAIFLGKTNTPDLLANYETDNFLTGRTNHPLDPALTPGGSSGGEAAAIAAYCSPGGLASDGGGSIRIPAHFCGISGLKPTPGRIPATGHFPSLGYPGGLTAVAGPMAREATDLSLLFSALAGYDPEDPFGAPVPLRHAAADSSLRAGVWEQFYSVPVIPEIRESIRRAAALLRDMRIPVEEFSPRGLERAPNLWGFLFSQWPQQATRALLAGRESDAHWTLLESLGAPEVTAEQVLLNLAARDRMRASLIRQMDSMPVLLMPVCSIAAFRHRQRKWEIEGSTIGLFQAAMPAVMSNVLGLPSVTIPMGRTEAGLPVGIQLLGRPFADELLLDLAARLEEGRGPFTPDIPPAE